MDNPLRSARLDRGLTIDQVVSAANVSRQLIIRAEQGTYVNPPPSLVSYYARFEPPAFKTELTEGYHEFQSFTRAQNTAALLPTPPIPPATIHPLTFWRLASGIPALIQFCKLFCIQHSIAHKFETTRTFKTTPTSIRAALYDAQISPESLDLLELYYQNYRSPSPSPSPHPVGNAA